MAPSSRVEERSKRVEEGAISQRFKAANWLPRRRYSHPEDLARRLLQKNSRDVVGGRGAVGLNRGRAVRLGGQCVDLRLLGERYGPFVNNHGCQAGDAA